MGNAASLMSRVVTSGCYTLHMTTKLHGLLPYLLNTPLSTISSDLCHLCAQLPKPLFTKLIVAEFDSAVLLDELLWAEQCCPLLLWVPLRLIRQSCCK